MSDTFKTFNVARVQFYKTSGEGFAGSWYSYRVPDDITVKEGDIVVVSKHGSTTVNETICRVGTVIDALDDSYIPTSKPYEQVICVVNIDKMIEKRK